MHFTIPSDVVPIRQGDVLGWYDDSYKKIDKLAIVLTADCDIAQQKVTQHYSVLPVWRLDSYIRRTWLRQRVDRLTGQVVTQLSQKIASVRRDTASSSVAPDTDALLYWFTTANPHHFLGKLGADAKQSAVIGSLFDIGKKLVFLQGECDDDDAVRRYVQIVTDFRQEKLEASTIKIRGELKTFLSELPQDVFLLNSLPTTEADSYVVLLRFVDVAPANQISPGVISARDTGRTIVRLCRLADRYRFALSQRFGNLFSRIGLPAEYEDVQRSLIDSACGSIVKL